MPPWWSPCLYGLAEHHALCQTGHWEPVGLCSALSCSGPRVRARPGCYSGLESTHQSGSAALRCPPYNGCCKRPYQRHRRHRRRRHCCRPTAPLHGHPAARPLPGLGRVSRCQHGCYTTTATGSGSAVQRARTPRVGSKQHCAKLYLPPAGAVPLTSAACRMTC